MTKTSTFPLILDPWLKSLGGSGLWSLSRVSPSSNLGASSMFPSCKHDIHMFQGRYLTRSRWCVPFFRHGLWWLFFLSSSFIFFLTLFFLIFIIYDLVWPLRDATRRVMGLDLNPMVDMSQRRCTKSRPFNAGYLTSLFMGFVRSATLPTRLSISRQRVQQASGPDRPACLASYIR